MCSLEWKGTTGTLQINDQPVCERVTAPFTVDSLECAIKKVR